MGASRFLICADHTPNPNSHIRSDGFSECNSDLLPDNSTDDCVDVQSQSIPHAQSDPVADAGPDAEPYGATDAGPVRAADAGTDAGTDRPVAEDLHRLPEPSVLHPLAHRVVQADALANHDPDHHAGANVQSDDLSHTRANDVADGRAHTLADVRADGSSLVRAQFHAVDAVPNDGSDAVRHVRAAAARGWNGKPDERLCERPALLLRRVSVRAVLPHGRQRRREVVLRLALHTCALLRVGWHADDAADQPAHRCTDRDAQPRPRDPRVPAASSVHVLDRHGHAHLRAPTHRPADVPLHPADERPHPGRVRGCQLAVPDVG